MSFEAGKQAALSGKSLSDNPHTCGFTKLGAVKLTEEGVDWQNGFNSATVRTVTKAEWAAAIKGSPFKCDRNRQYWKKCK